MNYFTWCFTIKCACYIITAHVNRIWMYLKFIYVYEYEPTCSGILIIWISSTIERKVYYDKVKHTRLTPAINHKKMTILSGFDTLSIKFIMNENNKKKKKKNWKIVLCIYRWWTILYMSNNNCCHHYGTRCPRFETSLICRSYHQCVFLLYLCLPSYF